MKQQILIFTLGFLLTSIPSFASVETNSTASSEIQISDRNNYLGDTIIYRFDIASQHVDTKKVTSRNKDAVKYLLSNTYIKSNTRLKGIGMLGGEDSLLHAFKVDSLCDDSPLNPFTDICTNNSLTSENNSTTAKKGDIVVMHNSQLKNTPPTRLGLSYGTLLIPYKYHTKSKNISNGVTIGGYLGYRAYSSILGVQIQPIAFLGASNISIDKVDQNGQSNSETHFGVSYGIGLLTSIKNDFNMGMVIGADHINKGVGYENNGKPWIAIQLGYAFSN